MIKVGNALINKDKITRIQINEKEIEICYKVVGEENSVKRKAFKSKGKLNRKVQRRKDGLY